MPEQLEVITAPVSAVQTLLYGFVGTTPINGRALGTFFPTQPGNKIGDLVADTAGDVYEVNLGVIKKFMVQMLPGFNPVLLLVFDSNPNPKIGAGLQFIFALGSEVTMAAAATPPANTNYDVSTNYGLRGPQTFGPIELPGDYRYFRAYVMRRLIAGNTLPGQLTQFTETASIQTTEWSYSYSIVTFYGK